MPVLVVLAVMYTLYVARAFFLPIAFALLFSFLLRPVVRTLGRARIPAPLGAALVMGVLLAGIGAGLYELSGPVKSLTASVPEMLATAGRRTRRLVRPIERVTKTAEEVGQTGDASGAQKPAEVVVQGPSLLARVFGTTQIFLAAAVEVLILLYFLLAAGDAFLQKLINLLPQLRDKRAAREIALKTESSISTYLLTTAGVNALEGLAVAAAMSALGMPNPELWGALVFVFEFIPYVGALAMVGILAVAALTTFDTVGHALLVPASFLAINIVQANVVSPLLLGHRLALNPLAVLIGVAFWFWLWGVAGAFVAVPLMATFKIVCDHVDSLATVGDILGRPTATERKAVVTKAASGA
ncbi:MAG TPA: AI-2E family transporter [Gemmatimonadaceae bacterium]|nr:AI-2E family transporter [Gemmatimonadaceae bacterium]